MLPIIILCSMFLFFLSGGVHKIDEGHVGLYWRGGRLIEGTTEPGFHFMLPFITSYANIQTSVQTDRVENIPCGTSGGVMIYFDKIEVVNRLNKDFAWDTIKNYTINYDKTWIFDKIQ
jgi:erlin